MAYLRILQKCAVAGQHLDAGRVLAVPGELPVAAANVLARMGRAEVLDEEPAQKVEPSPRKRRTKADAESAE